MSNEPQSAADPRPNNEPYYIDTDCPDCGTDLVLYDKFRDGDEGEIWHDEWICPECDDGIYLDIPDEVAEELLVERASGNGDKEVTTDDKE